MRIRIHSTKFLQYDKERVINLKYIVKYMYVRLSNVFFKTLYRLYRPNFERKKYYSTICAIFKNEGTYLKEWVEYNKLIGIDHIYLYNNNSTDNYLEVLAPYLQDKYITLKDWTRNQAQMEAYVDCIESFSGEANWIGFIDLDEFIVPIHNNNMKDFLERFEQRPAVKIYWKLFGTSGLENRDRDGLVIEDFNSCWEKLVETGKCFYNTAYAFDYSKTAGLHHNLWTIIGNIHTPPVNCFDRISQKEYEFLPSANVDIQINHYFTKSYSEYIEKSAKGDVYFEQNPHNLDYFYRHEMMCVSSDHKIAKYIIKLKRAMQERK